VTAESPYFCMLPWTHLYVLPSGDARPCCEWRGPSLGNIKTSSPDRLRNGEEMLRLRRSMLAGIPVDGCSSCYKFESYGSEGSLRKWANKEFAALRPEALRAGPGALPESLPLRHLMIGFSNACNFRCRTCCAGLSSAWYEDGIRLVEKTLGKIGGAAAREYYSGLRSISVDGPEFWSAFEAMLPRLDSIHFVGGEPLISREHCRVLLRLVEKKMFHVRLLYNTNFSVTAFAGRDFFKLWTRFESVSVFASLDAMEERGEYIREGQDWAKIVSNRKRMLRACPRVRFAVVPTLSILNALHLPDFHRDWIEKGYVPIQEFLVNNILLSPAHYRARLLPPNIKRRTMEKYAGHVGYLRNRYGEGARSACRSFEAAIAAVSEDGSPADLEKFKAVTAALDEMRGRSFARVFPELTGIF